MSTDEKRIGVVLMNMGGPTADYAVRPFLYNLFRDHDIIKMGGGKFQEFFAKIISKFRAPNVQEDYEEINGCPRGCMGNKHCLNRKNSITSTCCSPINSLTEKQRRGLEKHLKNIMPDEQFVKVYTCMRYWLPFAETTMEDMEEDEITHAVMLPLYPQFSWTTTGSSFRDWETKRQGKFSHDTPWKEFHVKNYHLDEDYLSAMNDRIDEALADMDAETRNKTHFIFSAHGTPMLEVESGDPYTTEINQTMEAIMEMRDYDHEYWLGYQSKVGPQKWTQPNTAELAERHIEYGIKNFLMIPIAFVTDHVETLFELGVELVEDLEEEGYEFDSLKVMEGINDHPKFIKALGKQVLHKLDHEMSADGVSERQSQKISAE